MATTKNSLRILLIMPWDRRHDWYRGLLSSFVSYKPLTLPTLAALVPPELNAEVTVCDEMVDNCKRYQEKYDVVAMSFVAQEANRAYMLAADYRARGSFVVFGGYHMMFNNEEGLQHADSVISGPAEQAWPRFLRDYAAGHPQRFYHMPDISPEDMVIPKRDVLPNRKYLSYPTMLANPNCRKSCDFCVICKMWSCKPRRIGSVVEEIKALKGKYYIFYDPDFFDDREYALALMQAMEPLKIRWTGAACVSCAEDDELLEWAQRSGCAGLLLGLESMSRHTLRNSHKTTNTPEKYNQAVDKLREHGINVNACFVLGMDGDTAEDLRRLPEWVDYLGVALARFAVLTPAPGSEMYRRMDAENRIISKNWDDYTQNKVVFTPLNMSGLELQSIYNEVWRKTYTWKRVWRRVRNARTKSAKEKLNVLASNIGFKFLGKTVL